MGGLHVSTLLVKEDVGCKIGTLHCCCRVDATADSRSRLLRLQNKPNILPFVCKKCSSCQKTCISATVRLHPYVTLGYDCLLDPSWDCLMAPNQSASTSISVAEKTVVLWTLLRNNRFKNIFFISSCLFVKNAHPVRELVSEKGSTLIWSNPNLTTPKDTSSFQREVYRITQDHRSHQKVVHHHLK